MLRTLPPIKVRNSSGENQAFVVPINWAPDLKNKPQQEAYYSRADRLFYGGSAGGGKSDLILGLSLTAHRNSIIFRREYPQLKGLIRRSRAIVAGKGRYNNTEKVWTNLPGNRVLEFGAIQYEKDVEKFQGRDHDLKAYDEICHFSRFMFEFTSGWNRSADGHRCRIVCTGNPPTTPEGQWVREYWGPWLDTTHELYPYPSGELLWYVSANGEDLIVQKGGDRPAPIGIDIDGVVELVTPHSRTFIPASLADNSYLAKTGYRSVLQALPEPLRSQMLHGKFDLDWEDAPWQVVPSAWVEMAFERWENSCPLPTPLSCIGVDVARGGKDKTILALRRGYWIEELKTYPGKSTPDGGAVAAQVAKHWEDGCGINIDVVGVGTSVYDILKNSYSRVQAIGGSEKSIRSDRSGKLSFFNKRSEIVWLLREALDPDTGVHLAIPRDSKLKTELCAAHWSLVPPTAGDENKKGRIKIESKDDIVKRIGRSPDMADAIAYCWANQMDEFEPIEYGLDVRDISPRVPEIEATPQFTVKRRGRGGDRARLFS